MQRTRVVAKLLRSVWRRGIADRGVQARTERAKISVEGGNLRLPKCSLEKAMILACVLLVLCASGGTGEAMAQMQFQRIIGGTDNDLARPIIYTTDSGSYNANIYRYHTFSHDRFGGHGNFDLHHRWGRAGLERTAG